MNRIPQQSTVQSNQTARVTTLAWFMCGLIFVVYSAVLTTILQVGSEGDVEFSTVLRSDLRVDSRPGLVPYVAPSTNEVETATPRGPKLNSRRAIDRRLNKEWENPWDDSVLRIRGGMARRGYADDAPEEFERWVAFYPQGPDTFRLGKGEQTIAIASNAWLFGDDMLEIHATPDYYGLWRPWAKNRVLASPAEFDGTWQCEFFHATYTEAIELTFEASDEFPITGRLSIPSGLSKWSSSASVATAAGDESRFVLTLKRDATGSSAIRSNTYLLKLDGNYGCGLGRNGGCLRLTRAVEVATDVGGEL